MAMALAMALTGLLTGARPAAAHEVPARVTVRAFVKPEGQTLRVLVRVPFEAMRDLDVPLRGPGYLELSALDPVLREAAQLWIAGSLVLYEDGRALPAPRITAARVSLPSDQSFSDYDAARAHLAGARLSHDTELHWQQALLDVQLEYAISSAASKFAVDAAIAHLGLTTTTLLHFLPPVGAQRAFVFVGDAGRVTLDPRWHQAAWRFIKLGFAHIMGGLDHLLFVLCLVIPFRRVRPLVVIITSFTVGHSITLIASAFGIAPRALWFPPFIEMVIAASIVYMACENIVGARLERRWLFAFGFGLAHGFGFAFALRESLQFAGAHLVTSLLAFNIGVELGQLAVLVVAVPVLAWLLTRGVKERIGVILLSALVAHTAWHWMTARGSALRAYSFEWPAFDLVLLAGVMRWLMLALIATGAVWLLYGLAARLKQPAPIVEADG